MQRRQFLLGAAASGWLAACRRWGLSPQLQGQIVGANWQLGHRLQQLRAQAPFQGPRPRVEVLILGGGMAALAGAWRLVHAGLEDFLLLELEAELGGNSRCANYACSAAPWGAHYLPLPTQESTVVLRILEEMKILLGFDAQGQPRFDLDQVVHDPDERLFAFGSWEEGLFPRSGASSSELAQWQAFQQDMQSWKQRRDRQGRKAFALPLVFSSPEPEIRALDSITMAEYLGRKGWNSPRLRWYVEYCCRDDYGTSLERTSAWAGIHYFASRDSLFEAELTWPEGNQHLVRHLQSRLAERRRLKHLVLRVQAEAGEWHVDAWDAARECLVGWRAPTVLFALPTFQRPYLLGEPPRKDLSYAPWTVCNLVLSHIPPSAHEAEVGLCWDNVLYQSPSLGYVVATHQVASHPGGPSVFTYYRPWAEFEPAEARRRMLERSWSDMVTMVMEEMLRVHPDLAGGCERLDVMNFGHAMVSPLPGTIWGDTLRQAQRPRSGLHFAHSDLSGVSIFEEASFHGVRAAQEILAARGLLKDDFLRA